MTITLNGSVAEIIQNQVSTGEYQSPEDLVYEALEALVTQKIDAGINEGLADVKAGRGMELTPETLTEVLAKPLSQW